MVPVRGIRYVRGVASQAELCLARGSLTGEAILDAAEAIAADGFAALTVRAVAARLGAAPMALYNQPLNLFVAGFIGSPAMNFMPAEIEGDSVKLPLGSGKPTLTYPRTSSR